jgi:4-hydroxybenzoate polyprenyltransferase
LAASVDHGPVRTILLPALHAGWLVAAVAALLTFATAFGFGFRPDPAVLCAAFSGTLLVYTVDRGAGRSPEDRVNLPLRSAWITAHRAWLRVQAALALSVMAIAALGLRPRTLMAGAALGLVGMAYTLPLLPGRKRLKELVPIKAPLIGSMWAAGAVWIPLVQAGEGANAQAWGLFAHHAVVVTAAALIIDLRDLRGDAWALGGSLAGHLGPRRCRLLCAAMLLSAAAAVGASLVIGVATWSGAALALPELALLALLAWPPPARESLYHDLGVDGSLGLSGVAAVALGCLGAPPIFG